MKKLSLLLAVLSLVVFAGTAQANLLDDGSFELAENNTQNSNSDWTLIANQPNMAMDNAAQFSTSGFAASDGDDGVWFRSFTGLQNTNTPANADLTQTVMAPSAGDYTLTFDYLVEMNHTSVSSTASLSGSGGQMASLNLADNITATAGGGFNAFPPEVGMLTISGVNAGDMLTVAVSMVEGSDFGTDPQSFMVDNFHLVPEPTSLALLGLGLLGALGIRRKRR